MSRAAIALYNETKTPPFLVNFHTKTTINIINTLDFPPVLFTSCNFSGHRRQLVVAATFLRSFSRFHPSNVGKKLLALFDGCCWQTILLYIFLFKFVFI